MSFEVLQTEVRALPLVARRKLMAFMVALQDESREGYAAKLAQKIDDQSPDRWLSAEECEHKLGLADDSK
jgi:hypothetical protein